MGIIESRKGFRLSAIKEIAAYVKGKDLTKEEKKSLLRTIMIKYNLSYRTAREYLFGSGVDL